MSDTTNLEAERYGPEDSWPTPQQWVNKFLDADDDRRIKMAEWALMNAQATYRCFFQEDHQALLSHLRVLLRRTEATR